MYDSHDSITYLVDIASLDRVAGANDAPADLEAWCRRATEYLDQHEPEAWCCIVRPPKDGEAGQLTEYLPGGGYLPANRMLSSKELHEASDLFEAAWRHAWETEPAAEESALYDLATGEKLRSATAEEAAHSIRAARQDGGHGIIEADVDGQGRACYVR